MQRKYLNHGRKADVVLLDNDTVLKLFRTGYPRELVEREAEVARQAYQLGLPTPTVRDIHEDDGRYGLVISRVRGHALSSAMLRQPFLMPKVGTILARVQASVHEHEFTSLPCQRQRHQQLLEQSSDVPGRLREVALDALGKLPAGKAFCHGDIQPHHVLMSAAGPVLIDWAHAVQGNPVGDVAKAYIVLKLDETSSGPSSMVTGMIYRHIYQSYLRSYWQLRPTAQAEFQQWLLPMVAVRLAEGMPGERKALLAWSQRLSRQ